MCDETDNQRQIKAIVIKPYNYKGDLDFIIENWVIEDFYVKKQIYDLVFSDVDVYFENYRNERRRHFKLKAKKEKLRKCEVKLNERVVAIQIDYSIL